MIHELRLGLYITFFQDNNLLLKLQYHKVFNIVLNGRLIQHGRWVGGGGFPTTLQTAN